MQRGATFSQRRGASILCCTLMPQLASLVPPSTPFLAASLLTGSGLAASTAMIVPSTHALSCGSCDVTRYHGCRQSLPLPPCLRSENLAVGLREMWSSHDLSMAAARPPKPPHLAGVTALLELEASPETPIVVFKRNARCFFDQLRLKEDLHACFGRPPLLACDILRYTDMGLSDLHRHLWSGAIMDDALMVHPCCATWPMGFS